MRKRLWIIAGFLILAGFGAGILFTRYQRYEYAQKIHQKRIIQYRESDLPEEDSEVYAVLRIPALDVICPVAAGAEEEKLKAYVCIVQGGDLPGEADGNTVIAGHSARGSFLCDFCWFQNIARLKEGDELLLEFQNDSVYRYVVYEVLVDQAVGDLEPFQRVPGKEVLTLQTCTDGKHDARTYVHAYRAFGSGFEEDVPLQLK